MAIDLGIKERQALQKAGFSPLDIRRFQTGGADRQTRQAMSQALVNVANQAANPSSGSTPAPAKASNPNVSPSTVFGGAGTPAPNARPTPQSTGGMNSGTGGARMGGGVGGFTPGSGTGLLTPKKAPNIGQSVPGGGGPDPALSNSVPSGRTYPVDPYPIPKKRPQVVYTDAERQANDEALDRQPGDTGTTGPVNQPLPTAPTTPDITIPVITPKDFTPEGEAAAAKGYAPVYGAYDAAKANAQQQGDRSTTMVGGMFDQAIKDLAAQSAKTGQAYDATKQGVQTAGQELTNSIGQNYGAANADVAKLIQQIGGQSAAGEVLGRNASDQAWQQGQAAQNTNSLSGYFDAQKQGQADYAQNYANTVQNQGMTQKADIANSVGQQLFGIDQNVAATKAEQAQLAIKLAQDLSAQDLSAQNSNAGFSLQGQGMQSDAAWKAWQAAAQAVQEANDAARWEVERTDRNTQQDWENRRGTLNDQQDQENWLAEMEAAALGDAAGSGIDYTGNLSSIQQVEQAYPGKGKQMYNNAAMQANRVLRGDLTMDEFYEQIRYDAVQPGNNWDENDAVTVAIRAMEDMRKGGGFPKE